MAASYIKLASGTIASNTTSFTISSIPTTYSMLKLYLNMRGSASTQTIQLRVNGLTGTTDYYYGHQEANGGGSIIYTTSNGGTINLPSCMGTTTYTILGACEITFMNANQTTGSFGKSINWTAGLGYVGQTTAYMVYGFASVVNLQSTAITSITAIAGGGTNFVTNSTWQLYGLE